MPVYESILTQFSHNSRQRRQGDQPLPTAGFLFVLFFQSCLCFLYGFAVFFEVSIHELIFQFGVTANNALLDFLVAADDTLFDSCGHHRVGIITHISKCFIIVRK